MGRQPRVDRLPPRRKVTVLTIIVLVILVLLVLAFLSRGRLGW